MTTASDDDEQLVADLRAAMLRAGASTEQMTAAAEASYSWRTIDAELAALTEDSLVDGAVLAHAATAPVRELVFVGTQLTVEILVSDQLAGQVVPATAGTIAVSTPTGELGRATLDGNGHFSLPRPDHGLMRLRVWTQAGELRTEWVNLPAR